MHPILRFGMITDIHYAETHDAWFDPYWRVFRSAIPRLREAISFFNHQKVDFVIELGDLKDFTTNPEQTIRCLETIEACFAEFQGPRYHVPGNHDFDCISSEEFYSRTPNAGRITPNGYYSFDANGIHCIVLNGCYDSSFHHYQCDNPWNDTNLPPEELAWLKDDLASGSTPAIVFCHQRLDEAAAPLHNVKNAAAVRSILEASGRVQYVFTGHEHGGGSLLTNGILYTTLPALTNHDHNTFAIVDVFADGHCSLTQTTTQTL